MNVHILYRTEIINSFIFVIKQSNNLSTKCVLFKSGGNGYLHSIESECFVLTD
jgi:hypothetical protein